LTGYRAATGLLEPLAGGVLRRRARRGKEDAARLDERLGRASFPRPDGVLAWLHGASVGESLSLLPMVEAIAAARPDVAILVTSGTRTSAQLLAKRLPAGVTHQFAPVDAPRAVGRFLSHWRPDLGVLVESELWPNLVLGAHARGARLALLSAQLSPSSVRGWRRTPASARALLGAFDLILAKSGDAAEALTGLGAKVDGLADLKFGAAPLPVEPAALAQAQAEIGARPMILGASTHPGEDEIILDAFAALIARPEAPLLVIAPRHPERGPAIAALARSRGVSASLRSAGEQPGAGAVHVADTLGEMGLWYRLARLAVLGGSFVAGLEGHNPLEAARLSCPLVSGAHVSGWAAAFAELWRVTGDGPIDSARALERRIAAALDAPEAARASAALAAAHVEARDAEARRVPERVLALLP
jgi:3-deoxy-D-manno-octulosonic-acid transferase